MCSAVRRRMLFSGSTVSPVPDRGLGMTTRPLLGAGEGAGGAVGVRACGRFPRPGTSLLDGLLDVGAGDASAGTGRSDAIDVDAVVLDQPPDDGRHEPTRSTRCGRRRWCGWGGGRRGGSGRGRRRQWSRRGRSGCRRWRRGRRRRWRGLGGRRCGAAIVAGSVAHDREHRAHVDGVAFGNLDLGEVARHGRGHLGVDLVGRHFEQDLVLVDVLADLFEPFGDGSLGDRFTELGHLNVSHAVGALSSVIGSSV